MLSAMMLNVIAGMLSQGVVSTITITWFSDFAIHMCHVLSDVNWHENPVSFSSHTCILFVCTLTILESIYSSNVCICVVL